MQAISSQMILPDGAIDINGATYIPIDVNGRMTVTKAQTVSIVELGKCLLEAASNGDSELVKELMGKGAPFTTNWLGNGPLHYAAMNNHLETCQILLRAGISRDAKTKVDRTPLHIAAYQGYTPIVEALLMHGAEVDSRDMLRMTPLHWAVQNCHTDIINLLLRNGADPDSLSKFNKTPVDIALELQRVDILGMMQFVAKDPIDVAENLAIELRAEQMEQEKIIEALTDKDKEEHLEEIDLSEVTNNIKQESSNVTLDSLEMLREHGISFLPNDDSSVVASAVENGHSLVLTDVGRQVLNSTKPTEQSPAQRNRIKGSKIITVTTEQLLAMAGAQKNIFRKISSNGIDKSPKKIIMSKNKIILSKMPKVAKQPATQDVAADIESITKQLAEARRQAEEYKQMLKHKEAEAEKYKRQLQFIRQGK